MSWIRTCQHCGHKQEAETPYNGDFNTLCPVCKSMAMCIISPSGSIQYSDAERFEEPYNTQTSVDDIIAAEVEAYNNRNNGDHIAMWIRTCQECGYKQEAKPSSEYKGESWRDLKCRRCKSMALDYGSPSVIRDHDDTFGDD